MKCQQTVSRWRYNLFYGSDMEQAGKCKNSAKYKFIWRVDSPREATLYVCGTHKNELLRRTRVMNIPILWTEIGLQQDNDEPTE